MAKVTRREERTGQADLFAAAGLQTGPRSFDAERKMQLTAGYAMLRSTLISRGTSYYEDLLGVVLEMPLVWKSDVNLWIDEMHKAGEVEIPDLKGKERTPKPGYRIVWKGGANSDG